MAGLSASRRVGVGGANTLQVVLQDLRFEVVGQGQRLPANRLCGQRQQQQVGFERAAQCQARLLAKALLAQAIGQAFYIPQGIDPTPRIPLTLALVAQGCLQRRELRPVVQLLQGLGQVVEPFGGPFQGKRALECVNARRGVAPIGW